MNKFWWFPFPVEWWLVTTRFMTAEQAGFLINLMAECGNSPECGIPADPDTLWQRARAKNRKRFEFLSKPVLELFVLRNDFYYSRKLLELKEDLDEKTARRQAAGKAGATARWGSESAKQPDSNAMRLPSTPHADAIKSQCETMAYTVTDTIRDTEHNRTEDKNTSCAAASAAPEPVEPVISLPLNDGTEFSVEQKMLDEWLELYPGVDVRQALRNMRGWLLGNPRNRKTWSGIYKFIVSWLSKDQNKAPALSGKNGHRKLANIARLTEEDLSGGRTMNPDGTYRL